MVLQFDDVNDNQVLTPTQGIQQDISQGSAVYRQNTFRQSVPFGKPPDEMDAEAFVLKEDIAETQDRDQFFFCCHFIR